MTAGRRYVAEWNRVIGDNIRKAASALRRAGISVGILPHKTSMVLERPAWMSWADFKAAIRAVLQPRRGSVLMFSESSGKTFMCHNAGNRPGRFQLV